MRNPKTVGLILAILGLLSICSICPLALNNIAVMATSGGRASDIVNPYGQLFSTRVGNFTTATLVIAAQELCATLLAVVVLAIGAVLFFQSEATAKKKKATS